jgi:hypothetical protein
VATDQQPQAPPNAFRDLGLVLALVFCGPIGVILVLLSGWSWRTKAIAIAVWALLLGGGYGGYHASTQAGCPTPGTASSQCR